MTKCSNNKGLYQALVCRNVQLTDTFYRIRLRFESDGARAFAQTKPGQFAEFDLTRCALPAEDKIPQHIKDSAGREIILRRPFSFCDVKSKTNETFIDVIYCVVGPASLRMSNLKENEKISVIGPLGNGFSVPEKKAAALLIAGGMGAPPLLHLAQFLYAQHKNIEITAFNGAATASELLFNSQLEPINSPDGISLADFNSYIAATDDGSEGYKGFITECVEHWFDKVNDRPANEIVIYACGPEPMLAAAAKIAAKRNVDCQLSMERMMACGIGLCQSCAVECKDESGQGIYKLCCKDGPVFDSRKVMFK